jgi:hypothetical protein
MVFRGKISARPRNLDANVLKIRLREDREGRRSGKFQDQEKNAWEFCRKVRKMKE